ncbi:fumarylacetoacetate hydrolase family protein [Microbacterium sediminicola]|uniref:Fumarylacetoacetate hydrolase family protein n=1 Tax=Microbacterium sediminicola TaxID=415210 RepID=A0ABN2IDM1_9MICO
MTDWTGGLARALPEDAATATLVGRVWDPAVGGPTVVALRGDDLIDVSSSFPTMHALSETAAPARAVAAVSGPVLGRADEIFANTAPDSRDETRPWVLSPIDLHVVKAAGVTFPVSMLERIIEEKARGEADAADGVRAQVLEALGTDISNLTPGSPEAMRLKEVLLREGLWSQYLEVGIGPDAEVFTKAPVMSTVGSAVDVGLRGDSEWNNPEPEVVLVVSSTGTIVGATLGNDVNLRDIEGRSALLLGQAKDNNASASIGPFIRLFDEHFTLDTLRQETVTLTVDGADGFQMSATSPMASISRDPADLVAQTLGAHHQYPDGLVLYLGTMFAPIEDRDEAGRGFTHHIDDVVTIASPHLGALVNRVRRSETVAPWTFGVAALFANLATRNLLGKAS